jgi:galactose-6-phosphate isomerase
MINNRPWLDVSDVLTDPNFVDSIIVLRRKEVVNQYGESTLITTRNPGVNAVVCMASPNDLIRLDDQQRMGRVISIVTQFRLQGPSTGFQPDVVIWNGDNFVVATVDPYTNYGNGQIEALAISMDTQDIPPLTGEELTTDEGDILITDDSQPIVSDPINTEP